MKKVQAQVRKERFLDVDFALRSVGVPGLTVADEPNAGRGMWGYPVENAKHVLLTVVVEDGGVSRVVETIQSAASTSSWGDGRITVSALEQVIDIGSGASDWSELAAPSLRV